MGQKWPKYPEIRNKALAESRSRELAEVQQNQQILIRKCQDSIRNTINNLSPYGDDKIRKIREALRIVYDYIQTTNNE